MIVRIDHRAGGPSSRNGWHNRTNDEVLRFFDGLDLVEPGVVKIKEWRPASELEATAPAALQGGVGRKP